MRRAIDVLIAFAGLLVLAPMIIAVAVLVGAAIGRPLLFRQMRVGRGGRPFRLVKFRTMLERCDSAGRLLPDAARTPAAGRLLRRSRLDELPQLWNVLMGEMSLIGPRPVLPGSPPTLGTGGAMRAEVRPGLTGWAQVNGNSLLRDEDKLALDLWYVRSASPALDLLILLRTLGVLIGGERVGAAALLRAQAHLLPSEDGHTPDAPGA